MIKILNSSLKMIGILNNIHECTEHQVLNSEYTLDFSCTAEKLKTELLYDKTNIIECDGNYYKVFNFDELHETGGLVTFTCSAEHIGYEIIQEIFEDGFEYSGTVQEIGERACRNTRFDFISDIEGTYHIELNGVTNARAVIDRLCTLTGGEVKWDKFNIELKKNIGQNTIYVEFGKNCSSVKRHVQFEPDKVSYTVDLIDCNDEETKELRKVHLGDTIIIKDRMLQTENISKKVISIDIDKLANSAENVTDETIENFDRTIPSSTLCVLGDRETTVIEEIEKNIEIPDVDISIDNSQLIEVIEQKVFVSEVAMINNCWINELSVEFLETNFTALDTRQPYPEGGIRNFFRIHDEIHEHVTQVLSETETEEYKTPSGKQIYWTAIGNNAQAYQYFTITPPKEYNPNLTPDEINAFKVMVRKVESEIVKLSTNFEQLTDSSNDIVPCMIWGQGNGSGAVDSQYQTVVGKTLQCGQGLIYKSRKGLVLRYFNAIGKMYQVVIGEDGVEIDGKKVNKITFAPDGFGFNDESFFQWVQNGIKRLSDDTIITIEQITDSITTKVKKDGDI